MTTDTKNKTVTKTVTVTLHDLIEDYETLKRMKKTYSDTRDEMNEALDDILKAATKETEITSKLIDELDRKHGKKTQDLRKLLIVQDEGIHNFMLALYKTFYPEEFEKTFQDESNSAWIHVIKK